MSSIDRVIEKIQKLLALADATRNDNAHERATALRHAQRLMDEHHIEQAQLGKDTTDLGPRGKESVALGASRWKGSVVASVAQLYGLACYRSGTGARAVVYVVGRAHVRAVALGMVHYALVSIEREARRTYDPRAGRSRGAGVSWRNGAASGVWETVRELMREREQVTPEKTAGGTALVLVDHYRNELLANEGWLAEQGMRLRKGPAARSSDASAWAQGREYGRGISLRGQVGAEGGQRRLGG